MIRTQHAHAHNAHTCALTYAHTRIHTHTYLRITYTRRIHMDMYKHIHMHICVHTHTHTYAPQAIALAKVMEQDGETSVKEFYTIKYGTDNPRLHREDSELKRTRFLTNKSNKETRTSELQEGGGGAGRERVKGISGREEVGCVLGEPGYRCRQCSSVKWIHSFH